MRANSRLHLSQLLYTLARMPTLRRVGTGLSLALLLLLIAAGVLLVTDRPGLRAECFALGAPWEGKPVATTVSQPRLDSVSEIRQVINTEVSFSVRWSGWWAVSQEGRHRFTLKADDGGYLRIDGDLIVDSRDAPAKGRWVGRKTLEPGFHKVEIGFFQRYGDSDLAIRWTAPGSPRPKPTALPHAELYSGRPLFLRQSFRRALASWPSVYVRLLGATVLITAFLMLQSLARPLGNSLARVRSGLNRVNARRLRVALLLGFFAVAFLAFLPFTGTIRGGDDTAYLHAATFNQKAWFFNRYAHVYLLKLFVTLTGGDPFFGVRVWWSFVFATTVAALAVAVRSVGPGLQLRTLAATSFVLLAQTTLLGMIGAAFADYSAMMFITAAVAVYLHGLSRPVDRAPPRHEWHALAVGALTLAAFRSKEVGAVLLLLPILFLIEDGRLDLRRFARRMVYWTAGAVGALSVLVLLDGLILGDFLFTFEGSKLAQSRLMNFPEEIRPRRDSATWLRVVWQPWRPAGLSLRYLWLGVVAAAVAAGIRRCRLELRLLHLLPIAYFLALIVLYIQMPHPFSRRMMIPILPVACLMTGLLLHYAGLDEIPWRRLTAPRVLVPTAFAAALIFLFVVPYTTGNLLAKDFLPAAALGRFGWKPEVFLKGMLLPAVVLVVLSLFALVAGRRRARIVALLVTYLGFFGLGFELNRTSLAQHQAAQKGELLRYPWEAFRDEFEADRPQTIALSPDLQWRYQMSATTRAAIARLALGRRDLRVELSRELPVHADVAIASRQVYRRWLRQEPALAASAQTDPARFLVFLRPREAVVGSAESTD